MRKTNKKAVASYRAQLPPAHAIRAVIIIAILVLIYALVIVFSVKLTDYTNSITQANAKEITIVGFQIAEDKPQSLSKAMLKPKPAPAPKPTKQAKHKAKAEGSNVGVNGTYKITFYCACEKCCGKTDGITASGTKATAKRTIAAPKNFAFGTQLWIEGLGSYVVEDRGGSIKGKRIDIFVDSHAEALKLGVQYREVERVHD